ncbi:DUF2076 domain-containing protein [Actinoplanes sp. L3-i22]|uniref:DUF2076 domain-containing protein n=1 Tax=Actinoplanes sp. L3-i22 TaxID=2836373 RepID=UPI001C84A165|nr:DUF2076 domain-containing protein [Actinoplanes sp. L3-i22]
MTILLLLLLAGIGASFLLARGRRDTSVREDTAVSDARADAVRWYERLGGQLVNLRDDGGLARQALVDATERHQAAGGQLAQARTVTQYRLVRESALEGLAYVRAARITMGLDPGPELPPPDLARGAGVVTADQELYGGYRVGPRASAETPHYYPGGFRDGLPMPAGWYATPWWKTALAAGAGTLGGMLLLDSILGMGHHHGPGPDFF